jgi:hypothetical protein
MLLRNRQDVGLRNMTDPPGDGSGADGPDGDFLTVEQVAQLRQVTPAAIRAQLRTGSLAGEQVLQGQRTVWRIPVSAVRTRPPETGRRAPPAAAARPEPEPVRPTSERVDVLEAEVRRLRRQLTALADAHHRLLDAVTAGVPEDRV